MTVDERDTELSKIEAKYESSLKTLADEQLESNKEYEYKKAKALVELHDKKTSLSWKFRNSTVVIADDVK